MQAHRQVIRPNGRIISFELPKNFETNNEVEVIVLPTEKPSTARKKVDLRHLRGALSHLSEQQKQEAEQFFTDIRNEWERDI